ncbi:hypothetical protein HPP92_026014 [Vanilla planifolia]|uniref:Uncharacterized protein n=1 Tax=Vanilla planifolia TaxID=51239 RepID=A0A835PGE9_VANPL|nr:hypothetical protein HPP92_026014 [Vanilla planifolia]
MKPRCVATWARPRHFDNGCSSDSLLRRPSTDLRKMGRRIFVFIIGGATRSELRVAHKLSSKFRREIILGSTSFDDPAQFITKLKLLAVKDSSLEDLKQAKSNIYKQPLHPFSCPSSLKAFGSGV